MNLTWRILKITDFSETIYADLFKQLQDEQFQCVIEYDGKDIWLYYRPNDYYLQEQYMELGP